MNCTRKTFNNVIKAIIKKKLKYQHDILLYTKLQEIEFITCEEDICVWNENYSRKLYTVIEKYEHFLT